jgi:hypothetical protein
MKNLILVLLVLISISGNAQRFSNREYRKYSHNTRLAPRHQLHIQRKSVLQIFLERRIERLERRRDNCYTQHKYRGRIY